MRKLYLDLMHWTISSQLLPCHPHCSFDRSCRQTKSIARQIYRFGSVVASKLFTKFHKKGFELHVSRNFALSVVPNKSKFAILNIDQWTRAFLSFMAIYGERFTESVPHLIKHAETVRNLAASQVARSAWL
ncbi:MAG: hypothetical protein KAG86_01890, partial [Gammaproteobacteria bacterium]|nr:hypothetical protein [Gammaproteobacteria bacterium]